MTTNNQDLDQAGQDAAPMIGQQTSAPARASRRRMTNDGVAKPGDLMPAPVAADEMAAKFSRRRRFIKVGASTVPVAMTLTSQPVLAWHCNSTSAWGSGLMQNNTASVKARNDKTAIYKEWTPASNWKTNNGSAWCHPNLNCSVVKPVKCNDNNVADFDNCVGWTWHKTTDKNGKATKVSGDMVGNFNKGKTLTCSQFGINTTQVPGTAKVWDMLNTGNNFQKCMALAMLNERCFPESVGACLKSGKTKSSVLNQMATGSFSPVAGVTWNKDQIMDYLYDNWIVR